MKYLERASCYSIYFFVAVAFWNLVGAGLFGFMINPPIALYYMQGLNTTPLHGHAALLGVYGMLGMGLMLFSLRALRPGRPWRDGVINFAFWSMNIGLMAMVLLSLLPVGLMQTWASVEHGYWYARSAEFMQTDLMSRLRWNLLLRRTAMLPHGGAAQGRVASRRFRARFQRTLPRVQRAEAGDTVDWQDARDLRGCVPP